MLSGCMDTHTYCAHTRDLGAWLRAPIPIKALWTGHAAWMQLTINNIKWLQKANLVSR